MLYAVIVAVVQFAFDRWYVWRHPNTDGSDEASAGPKCCCCCCCPKRGAAFRRTCDPVHYLLQWPHRAVKKPRLTLVALGLLLTMYDSALDVVVVCGLCEYLYSTGALAPSLHHSSPQYTVVWSRIAAVAEAGRLRWW